jgi:hypothetical protein
MTLDERVKKKYDSSVRKNEYRQHYRDDVFPNCYGKQEAIDSHIRNPEDLIASIYTS